MSRHQWSRRAILGAGLGVGLAGCLDDVWSDESYNLPSVQSFSTLTVPSGIERLILIDGQRVAETPTHAAGAKTLLDSGHFASLPAPILQTFDTSTSDGIDLSAVGKLALFGGHQHQIGDSSAQSTRGYAAQIWAVWDIDDLLTELNEDGGRVRRYSGQDLHHIDGGVAVHIADNVPGVADTASLAVGKRDIVRDIIDAWQGRSQLITDDLLDGFDHIPSQAPVQGLLYRPDRLCAATSRTAKIDTDLVHHLSLYIADDPACSVGLWTSDGQVAELEAQVDEYTDTLEPSVAEAVELTTSDRHIVIDYHPMEATGTNVTSFLEPVLCTLSV